MSREASLKAAKASDENNRRKAVDVAGVKALKEKEDAAKKAVADAAKAEAAAWRTDEELAVALAEAHTKGFVYVSPTKHEVE